MTALAIGGGVALALVLVAGLAVIQARRRGRAEGGALAARQSEKGTRDAAHEMAARPDFDRVVERMRSDQF